jgi:hypothetical protein
MVDGYFFLLFDSHSVGITSGFVISDCCSFGSTEVGAVLVVAMMVE